MATTNSLTRVLARTVADLRVPLYPCEASAPPSVVCVTGASGFVAGVLVLRLLLAGHTVRGTVRDPHNEDKVKFLKALPGAAERLTLHKADLMSPGSFDEAVAGCEYVLHTASPFFTSAPGKELEKLINPAVEGTANVLGSCKKSPSISRVVLTSSCAAIFGDPLERGPDHTFTEADYNTYSTEKTMPYYVSKLRAEKKAFEIAATQSQWDLVAINPGTVFGPAIGDRLDGSVTELLHGSMMGKNPALPHLGVPVCDMDDVAAAHCVAMLHPKAQGRYIIAPACESIFTIMHDWCKPAYPGYSWPKVALPRWVACLVGPLVGQSRAVMRTTGKDRIAKISVDKAKTELGLTFRDPKDSVFSMVDRMIELGMVPDKRAA